MAKRSWAARLARWALSKMSVEQWFETFGRGGMTESAAGALVTQGSSMRVTAVMACISILSEDIAKLPLHVYRKQTDQTKVIATDHRVEKLFNKPNAWQSRFEFIEQMMACMLLRGNCYAVILRDWRGNPTSMVPINPDYVTVYEAPTGQVFYNVARRGQHDRVILLDVPLMIPFDDVLHIRWLSLFNSLYGSSRISFMRESIGLAIAQQDQAGQMVRNGSQIGGVLKADKKLQDDTYKRLRDQWRERYQGSQNTGETLILEAGLAYEKIGMTGLEAQFLQQRELTILEIARAFRVPPHKLGITERSTGNQLQQMDQDYANNTLSSWCERIENKIDDVFDLTNNDLFSEFDMDAFLRADIKTRYDAYRSGITGGFLRPNDVARKEGIKPDQAPEAERFWMPGNMIALGSPPPAPKPGAGVGSDSTGRPAEGGDGDGAAPAKPSPKQLNGHAKGGNGHAPEFPFWQTPKIEARGELKYSDDEPRVPAGSSEGGEWSGDGGGSGSGSDTGSGSSGKPAALTGDDHKKLKTWVAGEDDPDNVKAYNKLRKDSKFQATLDKLPQHEGNVYRGAFLSKAELKPYLKKNAVVQLSKLSAGTKRLDSTRDYLVTRQDEVAMTSSPVTFSFKNAVAADLSGLKGKEFEISRQDQEVILPLKAKYQVTRVVSHDFETEAGNVKSYEITLTRVKK